MTTTMWDHTEALSRQLDADTSTWLRLADDGDKATVVFLGEPHPRQVSFIDGKSVPFDAAARAAGHKPALRVAFNVALYDTGDVKVLEKGVVFFRDLLRVREHYGLERWSFELERHGAAKDPKTTYSILPERKLSAVERRAYRALVRFDLRALYAAPLAAFASVEKAHGRSIDAAIAAAIAAQLAAMPADAIALFLETFGVARVCDLPAVQRDRAIAFVAQLVEALNAPSGDRFT